MFIHIYNACVRARVYTQGRYINKYTYEIR